MRRILPITLSAMLLVPAVAYAQWNSDATPFDVTPLSELREEKTQAAWLPDGGAVLSWVRQNDDRSSTNLFVQVLDATGKPTLGDFGKRINATDGPSYCSSYPGMLTLADGSTIFIFGDNHKDVDGYKTNPYLYKVSATGELLTAAEGIELGNETESCRNFTLADMGGNIIATYVANKPGTYDAATRIYRLNENCGTVWSEPIVMDGQATIVPCNDGFIAVSVASNKLIAMKYGFDGTAKWTENAVLAPSVNIWGAPSAYADGRNGAVVPYEYMNQTTYQTYYSTAKVTTDGIVTEKWLEASSPVTDAMVDNSYYQGYEDGSIVALTVVRKDYSSPYELYACKYTAEGTKVTEEPVKIASAESDFKIVKVAPKGDNLMLTYTAAESYGSTRLIACRLDNGFRAVWSHSIAGPGSVSEIAVASNATAQAFFFTEAPSNTEVGVKGLRMFDDGTYTVPSRFDVDVTLTKAGTLASMIPADKMWTAKSLRVAGPINSDDVNIIRQMAGLKDYETETDGQVTDIDLADATVVAGGEPYCKYYDTDVWEDVSVGTEDNVFPQMFFRRCSIEHIVLPKSVTRIGAQALYSCSQLTEVEIPATVTAIDKEAFGGSGLVSVEVPENVTTLGSYVFWGCANLTDININGNWTEIPEGTFSQCSMESITIPSTVTKIGTAAFKDCANLKTIGGEENAETIGSYAFYNCIDLESIRFSDSLTSIGTEAFANDANLLIPAIPAKVEWIGRRAFNNCTSIEGYTMDAANKVYKVTDGIIYTANGENVVSCPSGRADAVVIADGTKSVEESCFESCVLLKELTLPATINEIGNDGLKFCLSLEKLTVDAITPPALGFRDVFTGIDTENCALIVPAASIDAYKAADGWKEFLNISEVRSIYDYDDAGAVWFDMNGRRVSRRQMIPGSVYVRVSDGKTVKAIAK